MTASVTDAVAAAARSFTFEFRSTTLGLAVMLALVLLMFTREMLKAHRGLHAVAKVRALDIAVWPLFITFGIIVIVRQLELI